ncbi:tyrosine-type recombinase/integrase [Ruminiclostridium papyrosolvens]|uniref:Integrase n=1 Tax=Ruminiclostridium papyrosolvens C7 TaxID=1330534 RepID=U4R0D5_9FIRM|nr:site-specific integrase [Ruminiclostridium papyrosolvens]EPR10121.1 hypothetical protein L323_14875 [Ruminiclostridium papyrosolvens C7]
MKQKKAKPKKNDIVRGSIELPKDPLTGKRRKKEFKGTPSEVKAKIAEWRLKIDRGEIDGQGNMALSAYLDLWLKVYCKKLAITTIQGYERYVKKHIKPTLGKIKLGELLPMQITNLYNEMADKKYSAKTILQTHSILRKSLQDALKNGFIYKNPCALVERPSIKQYKPNVYSSFDFLRLLEVSRNTEHELPIMFAGLCGLRRSEVCGLFWEDLDFENKILSVKRAAVPVKGTDKWEVTVKSTKTYSSERSLTYPDAMDNILKSKRGIGLIFHEADGTPMNGANYSHRFKNFLSRNNLKPIRFHDLRHFNAIIMLENGVSDKVAADRLGHANPNVTKSIYQHTTKKLDTDAANKIDKIINPVVFTSSDAK